jgi:hypothetical protein
MKILTALSIAATALGLAGCENLTATNVARIANSQAEASGSPFRWKTEDVGGGTVMIVVMADLPTGPTRADPVLKNDILALITKAEASEGRPDPQVEEVKPLKDGREVWVLKTVEGIAYIINLMPSPQGGTDIEMSGVQRYHKERAKSLRAAGNN